MLIVVGFPKEGFQKTTEELEYPSISFYNVFFRIISRIK